jgi:hypothetical protein
MTARLDISEDPRTGYYVIGWWDEDDGVEGDLLLGHVISVNDNDSPEEIGEAKEHNYVSDKLKQQQFPPDSVDSSGGFMWESRAQATAALRVAKTLLKQFRSDRPWPAWALRAVEAGWKPPRGWKP